MASSKVISVESLDDFTKKLSEAGGKLVVVDFYATWSAGESGCF